MTSSRGDHLRLPVGEMVKGRYEVIEEVGCGNFSKVYRCYDRRVNGEAKERRRAPVAMKVLKKDYRNDAAFERRMLRILQEKDTNRVARVCRMIEYFDWQDCPVFIMPIHGPSVRSRRLGVGRGVVTRPLLISFAYDLLETLSFVHFTCRMVHTDLKPENILIADPVPASDKSLGNSWVICDFGSASLWNMDRLDSDLISTRPYRAPEVVLGNKWFYPADMWSMGCILYEVAVGRRLFEVRDDNTHLQLMERRIGRLPDSMRRHAKYSPRFFNSRGDFIITSDVIRSGRCRLTNIADMFRHDPEFLHLLQGMFIYEPTKRVTAERALKDPIFDGIRCQRQSRPLTPAEGEANEEAAGAVPSAPCVGASPQLSGDSPRRPPAPSAGETAITAIPAIDLSGMQSSTYTDDQPPRKLSGIYGPPGSATSQSASSLSPPPAPAAASMASLISAAPGSSMQSSPAVSAARGALKTEPGTQPAASAAPQSQPKPQPVTPAARAGAVPDLRRSDAHGSSKRVAAGGAGGPPSRTSSAYSKKALGPTTPPTSRSHSRRSGGFQPVRTPRGQPATPMASREGPQRRGSSMGSGRRTPTVGGPSGESRLARRPTASPAEARAPSSSSGGGGRRPSTVSIVSVSDSAQRPRSAKEVRTPVHADAVQGLGFRRQPTTPRGRVSSRPVSGHVSPSSSVGSAPLPVPMANPVGAADPLSSPRLWSPTARDRPATAAAPLRSQPSPASTGGPAGQGRGVTSAERRPAMTSLQSSLRLGLSDGSGYRSPVQRSPRAVDPRGASVSSAPPPPTLSTTASPAGGTAGAARVPPVTSAHRHVRPPPQGGAVATTATPATAPVRVNGTGPREGPLAQGIDAAEGAAGVSHERAPHAAAVAAVVAAQTQTQRRLQPRMALRIPAGAVSVVSRRSPPVVIAQKSSGSGSSGGGGGGAGPPPPRAVADPSLPPTAPTSTGPAQHVSYGASSGRPRAREAPPRTGESDESPAKRSPQPASPMETRAPSGHPSWMSGIGGSNVGSPLLARTDSSLGTGSPRPDDYTSPQRDRPANSHLSSQVPSPMSPCLVSGFGSGASLRPRAVAPPSAPASAPSVPLEATASAPAPVGGAERRASGERKPPAPAAAAPPPAPPTPALVAAPSTAAAPTPTPTPTPAVPQTTAAVPTSPPTQPPTVASPVRAVEGRRPSTGSRVPQTIIAQRVRSQEGVEEPQTTGSGTRFVVRATVSQLHALPSPGRRGGEAESPSASRVVRDGAPPAGGQGEQGRGQPANTLRTPAHGPVTAVRVSGARATAAGSAARTGSTPRMYAFPMYGSGAGSGQGSGSARDRARGAGGGTAERAAVRRPLAAELREAAGPPPEGAGEVTGRISQGESPASLRRPVLDAERGSAGRHTRYIVARESTPAGGRGAASSTAESTAARFAALARDSRPLRGTPRAGSSSRLSGSLASTGPGAGSDVGASVEGESGGAGGRERRAPLRDGRTLRRLPGNPRGSGKSGCSGSSEPHTTGSIGSGSQSPPQSVQELVK